MIKHVGHENKGNLSPKTNVLMLKQVLSTCVIRNIWKQVRRSCMFIPRLKRLMVDPVILGKRGANDNLYKVDCVLMK